MAFLFKPILDILLKHVTVFPIRKNPAILRLTRLKYCILNSIRRWQTKIQNFRQSVISKICLNMFTYGRFWPNTFFLTAAEDKEHKFTTKVNQNNPNK